MALQRRIADPKRYGFAVGRVRVLETRLLTKATFERLLDAPSYADQRRILSETVYGGYLEQARTAEDVERALDRALADLYDDFLERANLPERIVRYFRVGHDFENLRGRLKAEALGIPATGLIGDLGSVRGDAFLGAVSELPDDLASAERRIRDRIADEEGRLDPELLDAALDAEMYRTLVGVACESKARFLCDLARFEVDAANVRAFVRLRARATPVAEAARHFVEGGTVPVEWFVDAYRLPLEEVAGRVTRTSAFRGIDSDAITDLVRLDVVVARLLARRTHEASMVAIGPEPVVAYVLDRRAEIATLRVLLIGKLAGTSTDVLRTRVRDVA